MKADPFLPRITNPFAVCRAWVRADPRVRVHRFPSVARDYGKIAALPSEWGQRLDGLGVSYRELRWLAGSASDSTKHLARYLDLVKMLEEIAEAGGEPAARGERFYALQTNHGYVGRYARRAATMAQRNGLDVEP